MRKAIQSFITKLQGHSNGKISGGFGSIRGGFSHSGVDINSCDNSGTCQGTNYTCDNTGDCSSATNHSNCTNSRQCPQGV